MPKYDGDKFSVPWPDWWLIRPARLRYAQYTISSTQIHCSTHNYHNKTASDQLNNYNYKS